MSEYQRREIETDRKMRLVLDWLASRVRARLNARIGGRITVEIILDEGYARKVRLIDSRTDDVRHDQVSGWMARVQAERIQDGLPGRLTAVVGTDDGSVVKVETTEEIVLN